MSTSMQEDPAAYWNDEAGPRWVRSATMLDTIMAPVSASILKAAALGPGERVLDIGSGAGALSTAAAEQVGSDGQVVGVDISSPLVAHANARSGEQVRFTHGDAEDADLPDVDIAISRFGIMFFRDTSRAFANIAKALAPNGRFAMACWQKLEQNPWITWPVAAMGDLVPAELENAYPSDADVPGPFRFADATRLTKTMLAVGCTEAEARPIIQPLVITGTVADIMNLIGQVGPLSRVLGMLDEDRAAEAKARVQSHLESMHDGNGIRLDAAWWVVTGR